MFPRREGGAEVGVMPPLRQRETNWGSRIAAAFFVLLIGVVALSNIAIACSPDPEGLYPKSAKRAVAVFYGQAIKSEIVRDSILSWGDVKLVEVDFDIQESFKGKLPKKASIFTHSDYSGGCGAPFVVGVRYFVVVLPFPNEFPLEAVPKNALGYVLVFNVEELPPDPPALAKRLKTLREMR